MQNEPPAELVEIAARALCAASSTKWRTNAGLSKAAIGMLDHDALNNHWRSKARAVLAAVTPLIEARVVGEIEACVMDVLGAVRDYLPPDGIPKDDFIHRGVGAVDNPVINPIIATIEQRGDYKESQS